MTIPNNVHMMWFTGPKSREFSFINLLAVKAAREVQKPDKLVFYYNVDHPENPYWEAAKSYADFVRYDPRERWAGEQIEYPQYQADLARLEILLDCGGIYLDTDALLLRPLTPLMEHSCVLGTESDTDTVANAVMLAEPHNPFLQKWLGALPPGLRSEVWAHHAVCLPAELLREDPMGVTRVPKSAFMPFGWQDKFILGPVGEDRLVDSYAVHMWDTIWHKDLAIVGDEYLAKADTVLGRVFRKYANTEYSIVPSSSISGKSTIEAVMARIRPETGLDVGAGCGTYAKMFPGVDWHGVEVWEPYVEDYGLRGLYRGGLTVADAREFSTTSQWDVAVAGDVLEHMPRDDAAELLAKLRTCAPYVIASIPIGHHPQGAWEGNPYEEHVTDNWTDDAVREAFGEPVFSQIDNEIGVYVFGSKPLPLRICVYAISKNEEQFIERFCESAKDADVVMIADTGSTDNTVQAARDRGAHVEHIAIKPWRFDDARNAALALIPADVDVCVSLDLDEELQPGWRAEIERVWTPGTTRLRYKFDWGAGIAFYYEKIHARSGYRWVHPCHEYPVPYLINERYAQTDMLLVVHKPDPTKSRGQYLDLLEMSVKEDPVDPRNAFYYARELSFHGLWEKAIAECNRYLALPGADWANERCYAYRVISRCYAEMGDLENALKAARQGVIEAPGTREPWCEIAKITYQQQRWAECFGAAMSALAITNREWVYTVDPEVWGALPHDYASIAAWNLGMGAEALRHAELAVSLAPDDLRLRDNVKRITESISAREAVVSEAA